MNIVSLQNLLNSITINDMTLIQTIFIVISFLLSFFAYLKAAKETKVNNSLMINQHHREIWLEYCRNLHFKRIFMKIVNLKKEPLTDQEKQFVNMIFLHMSESLSAVKHRSTYKIEGLRNDALDILSYPIPLAVWVEYRPYHDKFFVKFMDDVLEKIKIQKNKLKQIQHGKKILIKSNSRIPKKRN